jgi:HEAT repeat protein
MNAGENNMKNLIDDLRHPEPQTRIRAAWLLGMSKETGAVAPLVRALSENRDDPYILATIASALGLIGDLRVLDEMIALLKNSYQVVRTAAAEAIGLIGNDRGIKPLKSMLGDRSTAVRNAAAEALKNIASQED